MPAIIELDRVRKEYVMPGGVVHALRDVTLSFNQGDFVSIVGASGSGKSTLLYLLGLLVTPSAGSYRLSGQPMERLTDKQRAGIRGGKIGFVFQSFHLVPQLNVIQNVLMGTRYSENGNGTDHRERALSILKMVGLSHRLSHRPGELSNGEMQRVAIARALLGEPQLLLADEPTGNLDEGTGDEIFALLRSLHEQGKTIVMVTHNLRLAGQTPTRITLRNGEVVS